MRTAVATAVAVLASALVLTAAGCGTVGMAEGAGSGGGKEAFVARCGSCHTLQDAGTQGTIGPDLDAAFAQSRRDGLGESTIREVVHQQIFYPVESPPTGAPGMPGADDTLPECGAGQEPGAAGEEFCVDDREETAASIATYVASVAGAEAAAGEGE